MANQLLILQKVKRNGVRVEGEEALHFVICSSLLLEMNPVGTRQFKNLFLPPTPTPRRLSAPNSKRFVSDRAREERSDESRCGNQDDVVLVLALVDALPAAADVRGRRVPDVGSSYPPRGSRPRF